MRREDLFKDVYGSEGRQETAPRGGRRVDVGFSASLISQNRKQTQERKWKRINIKPRPPVTHFLQQGSTSQRFHTFENRVINWRQTSNT